MAGIFPEISSSPPDKRFSPKKTGAGASDFKDRLLSLQTDVEQITACFKPASFDLIIHHMALHHTRDYKTTLSDLSNILARGGYLVFNFHPPRGNETDHQRPARHLY